MRINKYLSECGFCSRREADRLTEVGAIKINGKVAVMGDQVNDGDSVFVYGRPVVRPDSHVYIAFNKPVGVICTLSEKEGRNLKEFFPGEKHITYAGRLDKASSGLLIMTDDGDLIDKLMTGRYGHEKEYVVTVNRGLDDEKIKAMESGVFLEEIGVATRPCKAWISGENEFHIVLTQGINRQIRRMCKNLGMSVKSLKRIRIENIYLDGLKPGQMRNIDEDTINALKKKIGCSLT